LKRFSLGIVPTHLDTTVYNKMFDVFVMSIVSTTTDDMQRVGVLCTPFDLNKKGVNTIDTLDCCSYYQINNMKKL